MGATELDREQHSKKFANIPFSLINWKLVGGKNGESRWLKKKDACPGHT